MAAGMGSHSAHKERRQENSVRRLHNQIQPNTAFLSLEMHNLCSFLKVSHSTGTFIEHVPTYACLKHIGYLITVCTQYSMDHITTAFLSWNFLSINIGVSKNLDGE